MANHPSFSRRTRQVPDPLTHAAQCSLGILLLLLLLRTVPARGAESDAPPSAAGKTASPAVLRAGFIYQAAPFPSAHASTIVETPAGLAAAWFGGSDEGNPDVCIWVSRYENEKWSAPELVADGVQADRQTRHPCWNPVLFQAGHDLLLFYKVGPNPREWWGMLTRSADHGHSWSTPRRLPDPCVGPVRCKPLVLPDGSLLCGSSLEQGGWRIHMERTPDLGLTWDHTPPLSDLSRVSLIQPTIIPWPGGRWQLLCRSRQGQVFSSRMGADWKSWSPPEPLDLPNPNSGIDAALLHNGQALLVYNHTRNGRSPLDIGLSKDGTTWERSLSLETEPGEFSYPAVIQATNGLVHVTYTWNRKRIKHVVLDPSRLPHQSGASDRPSGTPPARP